MLLKIKIALWQRAKPILNQSMKTIFIDATFIVNDKRMFFANRCIALALLDRCLFSSFPRHCAHLFLLEAEEGLSFAQMLG